MWVISRLSWPSQRAIAGFPRYVRAAHPGLLSPEQLRRDSHILGWLPSLAGETPPLSRRTRRACWMCVRRLFEDLIANGQPLTNDLLPRQDFPPRDPYLPQALSPDDDAPLANALLLLCCAARACVSASAVARTSIACGIPVASNGQPTSPWVSFTLNAGSPPTMPSAASWRTFFLCPAALPIRLVLRQTGYSLSLTAAMRPITLYTNSSSKPRAWRVVPLPSARIHYVPPTPLRCCAPVSVFPPSRSCWGTMTSA